MTGSTQGSTAASFFSRNFLLAAATLFGLIGLGWWLTSFTSLSSGRNPDLVASVEFEVGTVVGLNGSVLRSQGADRPRPLVLGELVAVGDVLTVSATENGEDREVADLPAQASLLLSSGHSLRLDSGSKVGFLGNNRIELTSGRVYISSNSLSPSASSRVRRDRKGVQVVTALGSVSEIGTQFEVALVQDDAGSPRLRTRVREGEVVFQIGGEVSGEISGEISAQSNPEAEAKATASAIAGEQLLGRAGGIITRSEVAVFGDSWEWVLAGAVPFSVDGRSGADLLGWLARETGRTVEYTSPAVAAAAQELFSGDVTVGAGEALSYLLTLNLSASFDEGKIVVSEV